MPTVPVARHQCPARARWVLALLLALSAAAGARAQAPATEPLDEYLSAQSWSDQTYGLKLRPPLGSLLQHANADDALLRIFKGNAYSITVRIKKTDRATNIAAVMQEAVSQVVAATLYSALPLSQRSDMTVNGHSAGYFYFAITPVKGPKWVLGQGFYQITPDTYAVLEIAINNPADGPAIQPVFEGVMQSICLEDPRQLANQRQQMLTRGSACLKALDPSSLARDLGPDQLFRILQNGQDVGYMKITGQRDRELATPGIRIKVQSRIDLRADAFDTDCWFFLSDDGTQELWSVNTAIRPLSPAPTPAPQNPTALTSAQWSETGVRSGDKITITRTAPADKTTHTWNLADLGDLPRSAYLSQVETYLLPYILPHDQSETLAFYAYYVNSGKLSIRTARVVPQPGGGYTIYNRNGLDEPEEPSRYDASNKLIDRDLGQGRVVKPTTPAELEAIWRHR